ncbi:hypothetical protein AAHE18_01G259400 [Arachis hypogaea]
MNSKQKTKLSLIEGKTTKTTKKASKCTTKKASSLNAKTTKNLKSVSSRKGNEKVEAKPELASNDILREIVHTLDEEHTLPSDHSMLPSAATKGLNHAGHGTCPSESLSILSAGGEGKRSHTRTLSSSSLSLISFGNKGKISHSRTPSGSSLPLISSGGKGKKSHSRSISLSDFSLNISNGKPGKKSHSRSTSLSDFSLNTSNGKQHDDATLKKTGNSENVKMGYQVKPRVSTVVGETNKVAPRKLTFRRGKVIEIQPENNNIPRRLKFRPKQLK